MVSFHSSSGYGHVDGVIGLQHGDEGKGRLIDELARNYHWVARYNGGSNAGHTVEADGKKLALHQVPSGVVYPDKKLYIGAQCVIHPQKLLAEIQEIEAAGITVRNRLRISAQASIIQPAHVLRDIATMKDRVGTTGNGIGPAYADQAARVDGNRQLDIRLGDLIMNLEWSLEQIRLNLIAEIDRTGSSCNVTKEMFSLQAAIAQITPLIEKDPQLLLKEIRRGMDVLLEGAQAFGLDKTYGATPDVTGSNTGFAAGFVSTGIPVDHKRMAYGVAKLVPSRVGHGPFPSEYGGNQSEEYCMEQGGALHTKEWELREFGNRIQQLLHSSDPLEVGIALRMLGDEYGATTRRPRRLGVFDPLQVGNAVALNGIDQVLLTKGDCLKIFSKTRNRQIPLVREYRIHDQVIDYVPMFGAELRQVRTVQDGFDTFEVDVSECRRFSEFPAELRAYINAVRERIGCDVYGVGVGPRREQVVHL